MLADDGDEDGDDHDGDDGVAYFMVFCESLFAGICFFMHFSFLFLFIYSFIYSFYLWKFVVMHFYGIYF